MDSLMYSYQSGTNKLDHINDAVNANNYTDDIDDQATGNYNYDAIGNLVKDSASGISNINWTVYGKIDSITKTNGSTIKYLYDAAGNRISKTVMHSGITTTTGYVRDASGNVMSVYTAADTTNSGHLMQSEVDLYGSSRLGIWKPGIDVDYLTPATDTIVPLLGTGYSLTFTRGNKLFELSNHLGNVLTTLSDKKLQHTSDNATVDYYQPDVVSAGDYYPFGMGMPGRSYAAGSSYRYGFNGKEKDPDLDGNNYDYGFRIYNPQIGRFLSVDPLIKKYPELTPYQFASNTPIQAIDLDGLEKLIYIYNFTADKITKTQIELPKAGPLGNGVLVKSDYKGKDHYYYGGEIPDANLASFKKAYEGVTLDKKGNHIGYLDSRGNPTIGYGHLIVKGESYKVGSTITDKEALKLFDDESAGIKGQVDKKIAKYTLNTNQLNALYDASFNMGPNKLSQYSEDDSKFGGENFFLKFMGGGEGIMKRRYAEGLLYSEGKYYNFDFISGKKLQTKAEKVIKGAMPSTDVIQATDTKETRTETKH